MIAALVHTAYSPSIKDRRDCSGAIYLPDGQVVAQSDVGVPLHLGVMSVVVGTVLAHYSLDDMSPGDDIMMNTPYPAGPGHLNDVTLVSPVFYQGDVIALVANIAHHVDVGGSVPGSMPADSIEIFQEGLQIPPLKIVKRNQVDRELLAFFLSNNFCSGKNRFFYLFNAEGYNVTIPLFKLFEYQVIQNKVPHFNISPLITDPRHIVCRIF